MKDFTHLVIIRHSYPADHPDKKRRDELFLKTLDSLKAQTNSQFDVAVVGIHIKSLKGIPEYIQKNVTSEYVITTRLDNDDLLHPEYIDKIQKMAKSLYEIPAVIDTKGYRINLNTGKCVHFDYYSKQASSPFISLVEKTKDAKGVYHLKHGQMGKEYPYTQIGERLWCQVIHSCNKVMKWNEKDKEVTKPDWI